MIIIDRDNKTYKCPFCGHDQAYAGGYLKDNTGYCGRVNGSDGYEYSSFDIFTLRCSNANCKRISVVAFNKGFNTQIDLIPKVTMNHYPDYIPEQIRRDYEEANRIMEGSPKAAATLLRRCLQGMIHDYWGIHEKNLNAEISSLKDKVTVAQWKAIDGLRKIGNIGAHMEKDVDLIIDIDEDEAQKLMKLIELLIEKWYIARHDEEELLKDITNIADKKEALRNS